ncbi:molybdate ABC transporter substrate-binding protein [Roseicyclus sediminis]|uniref:molybdate ABC transporter substrate-binding protein n=1 Tax=Roseicyclus sediminis TaxID=2980997 RepID=UPI0038736540
MNGCGSILSVAAVLFAAFAAPVAAERVTVFAAASLTTALAEVEAGFEAETGHDLVVSLAGSSALARQIQQGAPADVFISASPDWMDVLEAEGLLSPGTRADLLGNRLVLVAYGPEAPEVVVAPGFDLVGLLDGGRLAMALVEAVPAGIYGRAALEHLGLWDDVAPHVAETDNVRTALALVAQGEAPLGIVYASDAIAAEAEVSVVFTFPEDSHPPIVYPAAALAGRDGEGVAAFLTYLRSDAARAAFERQGFTMLAR